jgi:hypothetical protein
MNSCRNHVGKIKKKSVVNLINENNHDTFPLITLVYEKERYPLMVSIPIDFWVKYNLEIDNQEQQEERIAKNDSMPMQNVSLRGMIW